MASLVESGSSVADVGTDHGYIPVYLVENKISPFVVAMDINEKPLASCKSLVKAAGFEDVILTSFQTVLKSSIGANVILLLLPEWVLN